MKTFYLVRHGQKEPTAGDPALTTFGLEQAKLTGKFLRQHPIQKIVASPALRTQQTAQQIASFLSLPVETHDQLRERANWGDLSGQTLEEFFEMWSEATLDRDLQPKVGDSSRKAGQRVEQVVSTLQNEEATHIVLVSHGGVIADFLRNVFGDEQLNSLLHQFDHGRGYRIDECSITEITFSENTPTLKSLAVVHHLQELKRSLE